MSGITAKVAKSGRIPPKVRGNRKGVPNKNTQQIKDMLLEALHGVGGVEYLMECATNDKSKTAFLGLIGKVMPTQITGSDGGDLKIVTRVELVSL